MLISFAAKPPTVPHIKIDGKDIERVESCTLLGITLNDQLSWHDHVDKLYKKATQRLHFLVQLKRTRADSNAILKVYTSLIRPLMEYACQLWHAGLTGYQRDLIESIQVRALAIAFPSLSYDEALSQSTLPTLYTRRDELCKRMFVAAQDPAHKLYHLLPPQRSVAKELRNSYKFPIPMCKTDRFKNSFVNYCLINKL